MNIAMVLSGFYPVTGGAERQAQLLGKQLIERGHTVSVVTRLYPGLLKNEWIDGIHVHRIAISGNGRNYLSGLMFTLGAALWLTKHKDKIDIIHAHQMLSPASVALLAKFWIGKPILVKVACSGPYGDIASFKKRPFWQLRRHLLNRVDRFLVLNEESRQELSELGLVSTQIVSVCNGVDTSRFQPLLNHNINDPLTVLFVGRLSEQKGLDILIQAWQQVCESNINREIQLVLVGDGAEYSRLYTMVMELGLSKNVHFIGNTDKVEDYLLEADLFVLPSRSEGLPNAVLEAMACGLPVVATGVGGIPALVVSEKTGLLISVDDTSALAKALIRLISNDQLRMHMSREARQHIEQNYAMDVVTTDYINIYEEIISSLST